MKNITNPLKETSKNVGTCRNCQNLRVLGTGSQIILVCKITKRFKDYDNPCDCGAFKPKKNLGSVLWLEP